MRDKDAKPRMFIFSYLLKKSSLVSGSKRNVQHDVSKHEEGNDKGGCQPQHREDDNFLNAGKFDLRFIHHDHLVLHYNTYLISHSRNVILKICLALPLDFMIVLLTYSNLLLPLLVFQSFFLVLVAFRMPLLRCRSVIEQLSYSGCLFPFPLPRSSHQP